MSAISPELAALRRRQTTPFLDAIKHYMDKKNGDRWDDPQSAIREFAKIYEDAEDIDKALIVQLMELSIEDAMMSSCRLYWQTHPEKRPAPAITPKATPEARWSR